ncbi:unnamed protein product [uncultured bacterium]|nr:unnamed protein product [uncultured bacterium]
MRAPDGSAPPAAVAFSRSAIARASCGVSGPCWPSVSQRWRPLAVRYFRKYDLAPLGRQRTPKPRSSSSHRSASQVRGWSASTVRFVTFMLDPSLRLATTWQPPGNQPPATAGNPLQRIVQAARAVVQEGKQRDTPGNRRYQTQNLLPARACWFESGQGHQLLRGRNDRRAGSKSRAFCESRFDSDHWDQSQDRLARLATSQSADQRAPRSSP